MGSLEQAVRRSLADAAQGVPAYPPDPAGTAIRRGRRVRRWRAGGGAFALAVATVLAGGGTVAVQAQQRTGHDSAYPLRLSGPGGGYEATGPVVATDPTNSTDPQEAAIPVDVVVDEVLLARSGDQVALGAAGTLTEVYETPGGWLLVGAPPAGGTGVGVWFADASGRLTPLLAGPVQAVAVEPGGRRLAWRDATQMSIATVTAGRVGAPARTPVPAGVVPVGFAGAAVRLARVAADGAATAPAGQDLWFADQGRYTPRWVDSVVAVYGTLPDGQLVAQVLRDTGTGERCLALLGQRDLSANRTVCGLGLTAQARGWVSPGGRWLVAEVTASDGTQGALIDLSAVFGGDTRTVGVGSPPVGGAAWENPDTVVRVASGQLERLRLDRLWSGGARAAEQVELAGVHLGGRLLVVTHLPT